MTHLGATPLVACALIVTNAFRPNWFAFSDDMTSSAAAASFTPGAFPAVTVPSGLNAGFSAASAPMEASSLTLSSRVMTVAAPFFPGTLTGTTSVSNRPALPRSACLLVCEVEGIGILLLAGDCVLLGDRSRL